MSGGQNEDKNRQKRTVPTCRKVYFIKQNPDNSTDKLTDDEAQRLQVIFDEPLQSYAVWLRNMGISISGGGQSGMVVAEVANDEYFDVSENVNSIMKMSKEHFKLLARQLGKKWPDEGECSE